MERRKKICRRCRVSKWVAQFVGDCCKKCIRDADRLEQGMAKQCRRCHIVKGIAEFKVKNGKRTKTCFKCLEYCKKQGEKYRSKHRRAPTWNFEEIALWNQHQWGAP